MSKAHIPAPMELVKKLFKELKEENTKLNSEKVKIDTITGTTSEKGNLITPFKCNQRQILSAWTTSVTATYVGAVQNSTGYIGIHIEDSNWNPMANKEVTCSYVYVELS